MALATKCPHCNTTFRVAHDQLKLRGGIVRCGACNEVFDGNAALVDPAPRQPVIIDLPEAVHDAAPSAAEPAMPDSAAADAYPAAPPAQAASPLAAALPDADSHDRATAAPTFSSAWRFGTAGQSAVAPAEASPAEWPDDAAGQAPALAAELPEAAADTEVLPDATAPDAEPDFDLDLNGDEAPPAAPAAADLPAQDDVFDLDFDIDTPAHGNPVLAAETPALRDDYASAALSGADTLQDSGTMPDMPDMPAADAPPEDAPAEAPLHDGRREPTLDIPDEHLDAVALHDSFELDAYPHVHDDGLHSIDERGHTLDDAALLHHGERHHFSDSADAGHPPAAAPAPIHAGNGDDGDDVHDGDDDDIVTLSSAAAAPAPEPTAPATPLSARGLEEPEEPGFVKRSRRQERWGKASRIAMACALPLLLAGLAYQAVATFRNPLAASVPSLKPALVSACALAGCKVELPAQLDGLAIEQGELQTLADNIFSFSTSLRNTSPTAQSWPHIELILNDSADKPVLRRVFAPHDYLPPNTDLASGFLPRSEQPVKLYFELSRVKASGYHIAVFYP